MSQFVFLYLFWVGCLNPAVCRYGVCYLEGKLGEGLLPVCLGFFLPDGTSTGPPCEWLCGPGGAVELRLFASRDRSQTGVARALKLRVSDPLKNLLSACHPEAVS